ncbi:MAG: MFS transporter, partial [Solirubrobacteraceae bacterium]
MSAQNSWARGLRNLTRPWERRAKRRVIETVGGRMRARVIALLALVLALSSADNAAVGADAGPLKNALHLNFTEIGLLVALPTLAGAIATVPIGGLSDRVRRVSLLRASIIVWSLAMVAAGASDSFGSLLLSRLALGAVIGTVGPTLASLIGDFFASNERAKVYGFILTGELIGSVVGLFVSGNAAAISWRLAFWVLAIPSALLAWAIGRYLPEPARGGAGRLSVSVPLAPGRRPVQTADAAAADPARDDSTSELQRALEQAGVQPRAENVLSPGRHRMKLWDAVRYVLSVPTNVALIIASSLGYFFIAGILTFGVVFVRHHYSVGQSAATSLLAVLSIAAVVGVLVSGRLADALLRRGRVSSRVVVAAGSFLAAGALFLPPLLSHSLEIGLPLLWLAGPAARRHGYAAGDPDS